ncbi:MAG: hypothetical protein LBQ42_04045 [Synergistaceae bacterium]|jgi:hypothetical protein|nr:hypothetical protein [Synergistaceae bacterium]
MKDDIWGEVSFDTGWNRNDKIHLWETDYEILVTAVAYYEHEAITDEQRRAYQDFGRDKTAMEKKIEQLLASHIEAPQKHLKPRFLVFERNGKYALMLDSDIDPDDGIAVQLAPEEKVMSQDAYL